MNFYEYRKTSDYGTRTDPINGTTKKHNGVDYALPLNTEVLSNVSGTVTKSSYESGGFGNYVVIKDGTGKLHYYAHLNKSNVNVGDSISVGESIGLSGSTGRSTGAHLHYEVRANGTSINPNFFLTENIGESTKVGLEFDEVTTQNTSWWNVKDKLKIAVLNIFKFIIIALLIVLFVVFTTKALDISII